jgi:ribonuclease BN (tRNA processing enzyme)
VPEPRWRALAPALNGFGTSESVTVKAFYVAHGDDVEAFGFRFETPDRTIVISGDTTPTQSVIENRQSCDVLIHESYRPSIESRRSGRRGPKSERSLSEEIRSA